MDRTQQPACNQHEQITLKERFTATEANGKRKNAISFQHYTSTILIRVYLPHSSCSCLLCFILEVSMVIIYNWRSKNLSLVPNVHPCLSHFYGSKMRNFFSKLSTNFYIYANCIAIYL